jgi:hypothetical protein
MFHAQRSEILQEVDHFVAAEGRGQPGRHEGDGAYVDLCDIAVGYGRTLPVVSRKRTESPDQGLCQTEMKERGTKKANLPRCKSVLQLDHPDISEADRIPMVLHLQRAFVPVLLVFRN